MRTRLLIIVCIIIWSAIHAISQQALQTPDEFLGYKHGSRFSPHHLLVDYFKHVDEATDKVVLINYGESYELRPLIAAIISSPENIRRYETIRSNNLKRTGLLEGNVSEDDVAIVYLSYSIHGNEAAGSESSMAVLHALAQGGPEIDAWLSNTIVIIDPSLNPDGYSRYTHWSNSVSSTPFNADRETREHDEPWPGGRTNHYYFDLNRDWAWQTQKESRERLAFYLSWMPHVHADIHEMHGESSYYFAPAAQPYHPYLTSWQSEFQHDIGRNHATYFDKYGWRYFTKEVFDLFYPSYGDTYPMLSGAIGMTYEQAGSGGAGRSLNISNGDTLKLADRIAHHYTTSLSTIEVASKNAKKLVSEFTNYYKKALTNTDNEYKSYVIKSTNHPGRINDLITLLDRQQIKYGVLEEENKNVKGFNYLSGANETFTAQSGDLIIPALQPRAALLNALFEPEATLADSLTYDITAWSIPLAYGVNTFATSETFKIKPYKQAINTGKDIDNLPYAYAIQWGSVPSVKLLAQLLKHGLVGRYATQAFKVRGINYQPGTILFLRADNRNHPAFDQIIRDEIQKTVVPVSTITTGFVDEGKDLGSESYSLIRKPEVLTISGSGVSSQSIGQIWHFFEEELNYALNIIEINKLNHVPLEKYNVIILPEGSYSINNDFFEKLMAWSRSGGQVIALGSALHILSGKDGIAIKSKGGDATEKLPMEDLAHYPEAYNAGLRKSISRDISGAVFQTVMDKTHPLNFGLGETYWTLKTSPASFSWLPSGGNAIYLDAKPRHYGFAGAKALEKVSRTLIAGREQTGRGGFVYMVDNPLFRSFWNSGKVLFSNALFF